MVCNRLWNIATGQLSLLSQASLIEMFSIRFCAPVYSFFEVAVEVEVGVEVGMLLEK